MKTAGRFVGALIFITAVLTATSPVSAAPSPSALRGPSGCPIGLDEKEWVCLTVDEARGEKMRRLDLQDQIIDLRQENQSLKRRIPSGLRKFATPWASVGAEYLPNDRSYHPYGYAGLSVGRLDFWAGFSGDSPSAGMGFRF